MKSAYWLSQNVRVGVYLTQYLLAQRITARRLAKRRSVAAPAAASRSPEPQAGKPTAIPGIPDLLKDLRALLARDWRNIEEGRYGPPHDIVTDPRRLWARTRAYFADLPAVVERRASRDFDEVVRDGPAGAPATASALPEYYLRNFHYQTDGYLSRHSAGLYDHQVEVLFFGSADAMRRQALVPLADVLNHRRIAETRLLDVACGTGRFLTFVKDNYPRLPVVAFDLSPHYLHEARRQLSPWSEVSFARGLAETLPFADASFDLVTCVYLLHEVPADVRRRIMAEFARVLRPNGRLVVVDSLQLGDRPYFDVLIRSFPQSFHEPYYPAYARTDLPALGTSLGLIHRASELAFLSKVFTFDKP